MMDPKDSISACSAGRTARLLVTVPLMTICLLSHVGCQTITGILLCSVCGRIRRTYICWAPAM